MCTMIVFALQQQRLSIGSTVSRSGIPAVVLDREPRSEAEAEHREQIVNKGVRSLSGDKEINEALVHDDEATLRSKLVPADLATRHDDDIIPAMSAAEACNLRQPRQPSVRTPVQRVPIHLETVVSRS